MPTIKEIAELAGVSRGTVDRVLNKRGGVNPTTEEKVLEIAKALNYKPNLAGTILAAQKKRLMLGVVLLGVGTPFYDDVGCSAEGSGIGKLQLYCCCQTHRIRCHSPTSGDPGTGGGRCKRHCHYPLQR